MRKILVRDWKFNVESLASCSQIDNTVVFYDRNYALSFYDNFDRINPDELWINSSTIDKNSLDNIKQNLKIKIIEYNLNYILPNALAKISGDISDTISVIITKDHNIPQDKIFQYDNMYMKFYTIGFDIYHVQNCGRLENCRDITQVIYASQKVLIDDNVYSSLCNYYDKTYGLFKNKGTIGWNSPSKNIKTNMDLFFENASK
jgi:hypothetical protein